MSVTDRAKTLFAFGLLGSLVACGSSTHGDVEKFAGDEADEAMVESGLSALPAGQVKVVGSLSSGQTSNPVSYSDPPLYRALSFRLSGPSAVDVWVRADGADAVAWLTDESFNVLATNDDAPGTLDSHLVASLVPGESQSFHVVFREASNRSATFVVSFTATPKESCSRGDCPPVSDPFNDDWCRGSAMTQAEALARFEQGSMYASSVGRFELALRTRTCNELTGCRSWLSAGRGRYPWPRVAVTNPSPETWWLPGGVLDLQIVTGAASGSSRILLKATTATSEPWVGYRLSSDAIGGPPSLSGTSFVGSTEYPTAFLGVTEPSLNFTGTIITNSCLRGTRKVRRTGAEAVWMEADLVLFGTFTR